MGWTVQLVREACRKFWPLRFVMLVHMEVGDLANFHGFAQSSSAGDWD